MLGRFLFVLPFLLLGIWWVVDGFVNTTRQLKQLIEKRKVDKNLFG